MRRSDIDCIVSRFSSVPTFVSSVPTFASSVPTFVSSVPTFVEYRASLPSLNRPVFTNTGVSTGCTLYSVHSRSGQSTFGSRAGHALSPSCFSKCYTAVSLLFYFCNCSYVPLSSKVSIAVLCYHALAYLLYNAAQAHPAVGNS